MGTGLRGHGRDLGFAHLPWDVMVHLEQRSDTLCPLLNRITVASLLRIILSWDTGEAGKSVGKLY